MPVDADLEKLTPHAEAVLEERKKHPDCTLATLYSKSTMPDGLRKAHCGLDSAVDRLYLGKKAEGDSERVVHLLHRYEKLVSGDVSG